MIFPDYFESLYYNNENAVSMFCKIEYNNQNIAILTPESKPQNRNKHQKW